MRLSSGFVTVVVLGSFLGCATPSAIKEATVVLDDGYRGNLRMMSQYQQLVAQINERHELWWKYARRRTLLKIALENATTDSRVPDEGLNESVADELRLQLGAALVEQINSIRLIGLPERRGTDGDVIFEAGHSSRRFTGIAESIPSLINAIDKQVDREYKSLVSEDKEGYRVYRTNVSALRRINATIQRYLNVDLTVPREDIYALTTATGNEE